MSDCALEDGRVLGDYGEVASEVDKAYRGGVERVNGDVAGGWLDESESGGMSASSDFLCQGQLTKTE